MATKLVASEFKTHICNQLIESITEVANTTYYGFIGNHVAYTAGESNIPEVTNSNEDILTEPFRNMIAGKKLTANDMKVMIPRYDWTTDTVYDIYDDQDGDLFTKQFYVAVDESAYIHVYKCLSNANGANSTAQPTFADVADDASLFANGDDYYETSDGYQWKYMYSIDSVTWNKFSTTEFMPVTPNTSVETLARNGSIDFIKVVDHGHTYNNFLNGQFKTSDIKVDGNPNQYRLADTFTHDNTVFTSTTGTGFYSNTIIHLMDGAGAGQYRKIVNSYSDGSGIIAVVNSGFAVSPDSTTTYEISPAVQVTSDGSQEVDCVARAIINSTSSNSVHRVEIIEPGLGYSYAYANVLMGTDATQVTEAVVRPIIPPHGGHGADAKRELGGKNICIHCKFANSENGLISTDNDWRRFGIIRDPLFSNVEIRMVKASDANAVGYDGNFVLNETFYQFKKIKLSGNVTVTTGNTTVVGSNTAEYSECIADGVNAQYVYLTDSGQNEHHFASVNAVGNAGTTIILNEAPDWSSANVQLYLARINSTGEVTNTELTFIYGNRVTPGMQLNQLLIGANSKAIANVTAIDIHHKYSNNFTFNTFEQLTRFVGTVSSGTFQEDEQVKQTVNGSVIATGVVHSSNVSSLSITTINGAFLTNTEIIGVNSAASFSISDKYNGDVDPTSGSVIYLQNDLAVTRANTQSEEIRVILEF